jgi:hypothetical protein
MLSQPLPMSANRALQEAHWLFFDLGNTLVSEDAATECRIQRLVEALFRHGRRRGPKRCFARSSLHTRSA